MSGEAEWPIEFFHCRYIICYAVLYVVTEQAALMNTFQSNAAGYNGEYLDALKKTNLTDWAKLSPGSGVKVDRRCDVSAGRNIMTNGWNGIERDGVSKPESLDYIWTGNGKKTRVLSGETETKLVKMNPGVDFLGKVRDDGSDHNPVVSILKIEKVL